MRRTLKTLGSIYTGLSLVTELVAEARITSLAFFETSLLSTLDAFLFLALVVATPFSLPLSIIRVYGGEA